MRGLSVRERKHWFKLARLRAGQRVAAQQKAEREIEKIEEESALNATLAKAKSMGKVTSFPHRQHSF